MKLNAETTKLIVDSIREGMPNGLAANKHDVATRTMKLWLSKGRAEDAVEPYLGFALAVDKARAEVAAPLIKKWLKAGDTDWRATESYLKRRFPEEFGDKVKNSNEHSGPSGGPIQSQAMSGDELAQFLRKGVLGIGSDGD